MTLRRRHAIGLLCGLVAAGMLLVGCAPTPAATVAPLAAIAPASPQQAGAALRFLTVNVELTDDGISPAMVAIPAGREIKLVVRNRGVTEHHYQVVGLPAKDVWRISTEGASATRDSNDAMATVSDAEHEDHHNHGASLGTYLSQTGITPGAGEVHAFAQGGGGGMDVLFFTATTPGTYEVRCPLHPDFVAKLIVF